MLFWNFESIAQNSIQLFTSFRLLWNINLTLKAHNEGKRYIWNQWNSRNIILWKRRQNLIYELLVLSCKWTGTVSHDVNWSIADLLLTFLGMSLNIITQFDNRIYISLRGEICFLLSFLGLPWYHISLRGEICFLLSFLGLPVAASYWPPGGPDSRKPAKYCNRSQQFRILQ